MNADKRAVIMYITQRIDAGRETKHDVNKLAHLTYELVEEQQAIADAWNDYQASGHYWTTEVRDTFTKVTALLDALIHDE